MRTWRLERYYYAIQISGISVLALFGISAWIFPEQFTFFGGKGIFLKLVISWVLYHIGLFIAHWYTERKIFFTMSRYGWIGFFLTIIVISGGSQSPVSYLLIFPLLVSGVDLDERDIRITGALVVSCFIFFLGRDFWNLGIGNLGLPIFNLIVFSVLALFIYIMVTDTIRSRSEREKAKAELEDIIKFDRIKRDFITVASHRLRTPLTGAKWALEEGDNKEGAKKLIENSIEVVNELLKTLEYNERDIKLEKKPVDMVKLFRKVLSDLAILVQQKKVTIDFKYEGDIRASVDERILEVALHHVIENAIKYSPHGKVAISLVQADSSVEIKIDDNGMGIASEDMPHVFEQFFRAKNAREAEPTASGIGLYTAKKIVEIHGGNIDIESELGKYTRVKVSIPRKKH